MKMSSANLLFIIFFVHFFAICCSGQYINNTTFGCIAAERKALLKISEGISDPYSRLSSWKGEDCCSWQGIGCDNPTGHVIGLDLSFGIFRAKIPGSSLSELKHLSELHLSSFSFQNNTFPYIFGNLSSLRVLDLSDATELVADDLTWISHLSLLEELHLGGVDLSQTKDLLKVLNMLPSIQYLNLYSCNLHNTNLDHSCISVNHTLANVQYLDLGFNSLDGELPCFLNNMTLLRTLYLSNNKYNSLGHQPSKLSNLVWVRLESNSLSDNIDRISELFLWNKCHLESLHLSYNHFYGDISIPFRNLTKCWKLKYLDLSNNVFINGSIPKSVGKLSALVTLDLHKNHLSGSIPSSLGDLKELRDLDLSFNLLSGKIPLSLGQLSNLVNLRMHGTSLDGIVFEEHFAKLSKLSFLGLWSLNFKVKSDWVPPFQLQGLTLVSCNIGGKFPQWVQLQTKLSSIWMINCSISDTLSNFLYNNTNLWELDLSNNHIHGPIPDNIGQMLPLLHELYLGQNSINGSLHDSLCELKLLVDMDISENHLSGNLPECFGNLYILSAMRLSSNDLSGVIPNSIGGAHRLKFLNLNNNSLTGELPTTMKNCTMLIVVDIGENKLHGNLPMWIGSHLLDLQVLRLRNNNFFGHIPFEVCRLVTLKIMDLANNNFNGVIPNCFGNFSGMFSHSMPNRQNYTSMSDLINWDQESFTEVLKGQELEYESKITRLLGNLDLSNNKFVGEIPWELTRLSGLQGLNLSHNHFVGKIPERIGDMKSIESLDFSVNNLSGAIPSSLADLSSINHLNLSNNNLSGRIPTGRQLQTLNDPSIYEGNPRLCGDPLPKQCDVEPVMVPNVRNNHVAGTGIDDDVLFAIVVICGAATGFWGVIGSLVFNRRWRHVYFKFVEAMIRRTFGM